MGAKRGIKRNNVRNNVDGERDIQQLNPRGCRWVGTLNNPLNNWQDLFQSIAKDLNIKYLVAEKEFAPTTGTPHIQFYFRLSNRLYKNTITSKFTGCFIDIANGSEVANYKYCTKTKVELLEIGNPIAAIEAERNKLEKTKEMLSDVLELSWNEFEAKWPYQAFHHYNKLMEYKLRHDKTIKIWDGNLKSKNKWVYGPPGTGKSRWARQQATNISKVYKKNLNKWWDGFHHEEAEVVVLDEMNLSKSVLVDQLKNWGDRYPLEGEVKGSAMTINALIRH
ncbi:replicase [Histomonas meleagridis]|uniref:replicase n=1 Tax=Histomonas meleagridis TaxID=135588 RepID=UPI00355987FA|nr:replicase [Histomonas meleagridis]KAH0805809.1 replicase [Histomonas meleagridis]